MESCNSLTLHGRWRAATGWGLLVAVGLACGVARAAAGAGREVPNFNLLDLAGRNHELYRAGGRAVVLFFTGTGCPIARKSAPKLRELRRGFAEQGVSFWIVNAYADDTVGDAWEEVRELGLQGFPYLRDRQQAVALAFGVDRTAEVVAIGTDDWRVFYQGAIDDQFVEGGERPRPTERFLAKALNAFLQGDPVSVSRTQARGCRLSFANVGGGNGPAPDYAREVAPLLRQHCVDCHREGAIGPWSMKSHARVRNYSRMIEEVLLTRRMPPWDPDPDYGHFSNAQSLTRDETQTLLRWVAAGAPRGDGPDPLAEPLPPLPDWPMGTPDVVLRLPKPEVVPATGVVDYRHIAIETPFTNDVWISGTDIRPGNRRVVHHAILYGQWPGCRDDGTGNGAFLCGWAPGTPPMAFPSGVAKLLPAGARLSLEMHYTTCGSEETDQTEVALYLAPGPQPRIAEVRAAVEPNLNIPPGSDEARHVAVFGFERPSTLYSLAPHMHVRGKSMKYELLLPNGHRETLLSVPRYDFNWQFSYHLQEPREVPAGAWLLVTGAFDNSPAQPGNPDPNQRIHWGPQSWDEMFIGFFDAAESAEPDPARPSAGGAR